MPHPIKISSNVGKVMNSSDIIEMKRLGTGKILVECKTAAAANKLASNPDLANFNLKAVIPNYRVLRTGIIRDIPQEFDVAEIKASLTTNQNHKIISVHRLNRKSTVNDMWYIRIYQKPEFATRAIETAMSVRHAAASLGVSSVAMLLTTMRAHARSRKTPRVVLTALEQFGGL
ncbi:PREDICTED: uncharacterized protein LOC105460653 isoform X2 [Wasmannia auropunctata]|uniref:uncharacterized protein LOC105460653 isoform X2 n=1 Tax=Wasmannia auropunctata TaxID=64793 RepID=UPI0005F0053D|nr:PREDICTED: uncharacterized protein LOC105460653 isoform X2 [Wasmannia auropunctata]